MKIFLTVFFLAASGFYLYPSVRAMMLDNKLEDMAPSERQEYISNNFETVQEVREESLNLGLDLLGGMHVTLEVEVDQLLRELANDTDETFNQVLSQSVDDVESSDESLIDVFVANFEELDADVRLSRYFRNAAAGITRRSSNADIQQWLRGEVESAVERAMEIIRDRVDRYGVTEPSIQRQGSRRVVVELPGVDDPERVRSLLKGTARLEFRLMPEPQQLQASLQQIIQYFDEQGTPADTTADAAAQDTTVDVDELLAQGQGTDGDAGTGNPLLDVMEPIGQSVQFGLVAEEDTAEARQLLSQPEVQQMLPRNTELMYTASPVTTTQDGHERYFLLGVREEVEMTGEVISDARVGYDQMNQAEVSMTMNSEGARTWARLTGANVNKPVAIVLDHVVYSYPVVQNRIVGGRSSITGLDSPEEASDIVNVLKSGALPAPVQIVAERTVGPSLGQESIRAGLMSVIVGLMIVGLFMILWYRAAGFVADLALIINLIFILGILAAFDATLTLPGIAGVVLTIGMAVDANVLIFERVREEAASGKTRKAALEGGYGKALSAIIDGNVTTFFVGAILFSFGVGPIQGFAVTLMAGILASLFSAIVFTRIIFDYWVVEQRKEVSFG